MMKKMGTMGEEKTREGGKGQEENQVVSRTLRVRDSYKFSARDISDKRGTGYSSLPPGGGASFVSSLVPADP